jgi:hypothetical protein
MARGIEPRGQLLQRAQRPQRERHLPTTGGGLGEVDALDEEQAKKILCVLLTAYAEDGRRWSDSSRTGK